MLAVPLTDYYEEVRRYLTCPEEVKDDLIYDVNRKVMDLNADRPDLDYDDVVDFLGEPENLAQSLMDNLDPDLPDLIEGHIKQEAKKSRLKTLVATISCIALLVLSVYTFYDKENNLYSIDKEVIITEEIVND